MKRNGVASFRQFDQNGVSDALRRIILSQFHAQAACLDANCRIQVWIKICRTSKHLSRNLILLNRNSRILETVLRQVTK